MTCFARYNLKMPLRSIATNLRQQNWSTLLLELLVVIFGLVLAFQVDRWWEERDDRSKEQEYIARLITEVRERFIGNTELINWIPRTRGVQREHILMNGIRLNRAKQLLESLEQSLEKVN